LSAGRAARRLRARPITRVAIGELDDLCPANRAPLECRSAGHATKARSCGCSRPSGSGPSQPQRPDCFSRGSDVRRGAKKRYVADPRDPPDSAAGCHPCRVPHPGRGARAHRNANLSRPACRQCRATRWLTAPGRPRSWAPRSGRHVGCDAPCRERSRASCWQVPRA
jgi:hypothetical protein